MQDNILEMRDITKSFFGVKVLKNAQLTVKKGQVHILLGENGAGKSTLIKILSGAYGREEGTVILDGNEMPPMPPGEVIKAGVSVIYQEFNLVPEMSVYENIFLGKEIVKGGRVDHKKEIEEAKKCMDRVGLDCSPKTLISELSVAKKQLVEIAKAISNDVKILVLDEPTAAITDKETEMLFDIIRELKKQGIGIIYISHRLSELLEIGDVCTVMRDGEYIDTVNIKDTTEDELTRLMVGRQVSFEKLENPHLKKDEIVLSVKNLNYKNLVRNVSFDLHKGEILGFAGLVGAGRTETAKTIIGDYKKDSGTVIYKGKEIGTNLSENIKNGIVYLSEDRKDEGLILMHSVAENIALPNLPKLCKPFLNRRKERSVSKDYIKSLKIKTFSELTDAKNLSGGNQQKVVIAKWLYSDADIYIFDEPTRGIDVGARDEIYNIMYDLIAKGASIIMISSDLVEVLKMSDRVVVMREGRINGIVENDGMLTQEETMKMELAEEEKHEENGRKILPFGGGPVQIFYLFCADPAGCDDHCAGGMGVYGIHQAELGVLWQSVGTACRILLAELRQCVEWSQDGRIYAQLRSGHSIGSGAVAGDCAAGGLLPVPFPVQGAQAAEHAVYGRSVHQCQLYRSSHLPDAA